MTTQLHLLNVRGQFDAIRRRVEDCFSLAVEQISRLLPLSSVDVVVYVDPEHVIPETGMGGYSPSADRIFIALDPENVKFQNDFEAEFVTTLGHELHHCARWSGPGYGHTLGEALETEGLACHFETELRAGAVPFYARALTHEALEALRVRAQAEPTQRSYDHRAWFFGSVERDIPRHAGYSLGYSVVSQFIEQHGIPASKLWAEPAERFYAGA